MCGIAGGWGREIDDVALDRALRRLAHRGPDGSGRRRAAGGVPWGLAHTRLAINDLTDDGAQPMSDPTGRYHMVFNGEIYNHPELARHCSALGRPVRSRMDGEVILHLYAEYGPSCFGRLNGIFAVALVDSVADTCVLARDPIGVKPLYYHRAGTGVTFGSEPAVLGDLGVDLGTPSRDGLAKFLTFLWIPAPDSPFAGVACLRPGEVLVCDTRGARGERAGPQLVPTGDHPGRRVTADEFGDRLAGACERQLLSDVPLGAMASGGIDSSLVVGAIGHRLRTAYTIVWDAPERDDEGWDAERSRARTVAARSAVALRELPGAAIDIRPPPSTGDLLADPSSALTRAIAARARADGIKVLFSGLGGDELLGGYRRHTAARMIELARRPVPGAARAVNRVMRPGTGESRRAEYVRRLARAFVAPDDVTAFMSLCSYSTAAERARVLGCDEREVADERVWERHHEVFATMPASMSLARRAMAVDLAVYLPGQGLAYADRSGMAEGVEIRVPWLDLEFVRWALELPTAQLLTLRKRKILARDRASDLFGPAVGAATKMNFGAPHAFVGDQTGGHSTRQDDYLRSAVSLLAEHAARWSPGERFASTGRSE